MPSQKHRSKEDTWTPDELNKALGKTSDRRHHRDEDAKRSRVIGDDKQRRHRDDDPDRRRRHRDEDENGKDLRLTEEERERQREERRRRREEKDGSSSKEKKGGKEIQFRGKSEHREIDLNEMEENDSDDRRRRNHGDRGHRRDDVDRERRHREREERHHNDSGDRERRRHHRDDDNDHEKRRKHRDEKDDRRSKHRDDDDREQRRKHRDEDEQDERERRRIERRREKEAKEDEERRRRHEEKKEKRKEKDRDPDRDRDRHREERSDRHRDRKDRDRNRETEEKKEEKREREREERKREREDRQREKEEKQKEEEKKKQEEEEDDYNYEEDFEDYEEDFEEDDDEERGSGNRHLDIQDDEVNDVLRALDAENERLLNSSRSPQVSAKHRIDYNRENSNLDDDSDDGYQKTAFQSRMDRPRTAINFVSAKQRAVSRKTASKTMQRGKDLLKMLELDFASFDIMDMPPVNEYDLYIRAFGSSNTKQAYVQTNEDNIEREIQTDEVDARQKWTQHPAEDFIGCGRGDGEKDLEEEEESQSKYNREQDLGRLNQFLEKAGQVIAILLEESKDEKSASRGQSQANINVSEGYTELDSLPILQGRHVIYSHFSPIQPNLLLTVYSPSSQVSEENPVSKRGVIFVWNTNEPNYPQKILVCSSQARCCCFSPVKPSLVFAGMVDGSIAMWDLREPTSIHRPTVVNEESYSLRYPTYDTAGVLKEENHHSPVSSIQPIYSYIDMSKTDGQKAHASEDTSSGFSFQLVSTEESAVLHFWVVAEIGRPEMAGSEDDLGLAPGAGVKLLKSSTLTMSNPSKDARLQTGLRALDMSLMPNDPNHFYVATDSGCIMHGIRFGKRTFPRAHSPVIDSIVDVVSIDFSPFDHPCFLAGCSDGNVSLYHTKSENPLISWPTLTQGRAVQCVRWSRSRPCVFYILDVASTLYVFDLLEGDVKPKQIETLSKESITSFSLTTVQRPDGLDTSGRDAQMLIGYESGKTEIHTIARALRVPEQLEADYLGSYLQRF